jgi:hypothetical protein
MVAVIVIRAVTVTAVTVTAIMAVVAAAVATVAVMTVAARFRLSGHADTGGGECGNERERKQHALEHRFLSLDAKRRPTKRGKCFGGPTRGLACREREDADVVPTPERYDVSRESSAICA